MNETTMFVIAMICYLSAFVMFSASLSLDRKNLYVYARCVNWVGMALAFCALGMRWYSAGHPPLSNMYESLATLSTFIVLAGSLFTSSQPLPLLEAGSSVGAVLMIGLGSLFSADVRPLIPALQSYWLHLHVSLAFVGEACFAVAFILSYLFCLRRILGDFSSRTLFDDAREKMACYAVVIGLPATFIAGMLLLASHLSSLPMYRERWTSIVWWVILPSCLVAVLLSVLAYLYRGAIDRGAEKWLPENDELDKLIYRAIALGYPLFTVGGLIFGMVWANKAWGRYWGWDPKETWALITFLVYSIYLHVRLSRGWNGTWTACLSVAGFIVTMFTLFGVNLLISSLHSYAGS
ncbi:MAG: c-type cytochrome biogenesis protein CcsB [Candidatus Riflebacteria bacterium]|nr:c-type cytochrome biogenesis protein CcsB [Candidatus Riflebacteria bacterium]